MKKLAVWIALVMALMHGTGMAEGLVWSGANAPYWHADAACRFGQTGWQGEAAPEAGEPRQVTAAEAEALGQKPCPGCATAFRPTFTGEFPEWTFDVEPWGSDPVEMTESGGWPRRVTALPPEVLAGWGDPAGRLHELFPEDTDPETGETVYSYPDDYAGIFVNNSECCTLMLRDPTPGRVAEWREALGCEFWVISAKYGWNELQALYRAARGFMGADVRLAKAGDARVFYIVSIGTDQIGNAVEIGVATEHFDEGARLMRQSLAFAGFSDPGMVRFVPAEYPHWLDEEDF